MSFWPRKRRRACIRLDKASLPKGSAASLSGAVAREQNVGLFGRQPVDAAERSDGPPFQEPFEIVGVCDRVGGETGDRHPAEQPAPYLGAVVEARLNQDVHGRRIEREPVEQVAQDQRMNATVTKSAEAEALDRIPNDVINRALAAIPVDYRDAVYLADVEGFSYKEIAAIMDTPVGTVMSRLHRGRKLLRERLEDYAIEHGYIKAPAS